MTVRNVKKPNSSSVQTRPFTIRVVKIFKTKDERILFAETGRFGSKTDRSQSPRRRPSFLVSSIARGIVACRRNLSRKKHLSRARPPFNEPSLSTIRSRVYKTTVLRIYARYRQCRLEGLKVFFEIELNSPRLIRCLEQCGRVSRTVLDESAHSGGELSLTLTTSMERSCLRTWFLKSNRYELWLLIEFSLIFIQHFPQNELYLGNYMFFEQKNPSFNKKRKGEGLKSFRI